jgi:hypothetical protein
LSTLLEEGLTDDERRILVWLGNYVSQRDICAWLGVSYAAGTQRIWRLRARLRLAAHKHLRAFHPREQLELARFFRRGGHDGSPPMHPTLDTAAPDGGSHDVP